MGCDVSHKALLGKLSFTASQVDRNNAVQVLVNEDHQALANPTITMQPLVLPAAIMFYQCAREGSKAFASLPMVR